MEFEVNTKVTIMLSVENEKHKWDMVKRIHAAVEDAKKEIEKEYGELIVTETHTHEFF